MLAECTTTVKRASVHTLGCRLNQSETSIIVDKLCDAGYELVPFGDPADLAIINTCTVTAEADAKSRQMIRSFVRANPHAYTAVIGCYSQMGYKALAEIEGVDLIVGNQDKLNVLDYVRQGKNSAPLLIRDRIERDDFTIDAPGRGASTTRANLKIQDGCDFMCTFCVIPFARGRARSRDFSDLLDEAQRLALNGTKELVLTGVNIGEYRHGGNTIVDVADALNEIHGIRRIRISSIEPTTVDEQLLNRMRDAEHALVSHLHLPLQSGSNRVLGIMKRRYSKEEFVSFVHQAYEIVPDICIGTDVLVGSPGETVEDFEETCSVLHEAHISYAHVFKYSERSGTPAARRPDKVSPEIKNLRSARIRKLSAKKHCSFLETFIGRSMQVLFEQEDGAWSGYTGNYIRVAARSDKQLANVLANARLDRVCGDFVLGSINDL